MCKQSDILHRRSDKKLSTADIVVFVKFSRVVLDFKWDIVEACYFSPPWDGLEKLSAGDSLYNQNSQSVTAV
jgi:hypothetical protein